MGRTCLSEHKTICALETRCNCTTQCSSPISSVSIWRRPIKRTENGLTGVMGSCQPDKNAAQYCQHCLALYVSHTLRFTFKEAVWFMGGAWLRSQRTWVMKRTLFQTAFLEIAPSSISPHSLHLHGAYTSSISGIGLEEQTLITAASMGQASRHSVAGSSGVVCQGLSQDCSHLKAEQFRWLRQDSLWLVRLGASVQC